MVESSKSRVEGTASDVSRVASVRHEDDKWG